jgi:hypothetical protein
MSICNTAATLALVLGSALAVAAQYCAVGNTNADNSELEPTGACCALGGACLDDVTASGCWTLYAGVWQGAGVACAATECYGACCIAGVCYDLDESQCINWYYGSWQGGGTTCDSAPCFLTGACCLPEGQCAQLGESECEAAAGAFVGVTVACEPSPCPTGYCAAGSSVCDEYISRVQIGAIDNSSGCTHYGDYTYLSTDVTRGAAYSIAVTNGVPYEADVCSTWIDWDGNEIFGDTAPEWISDVVGGGALPPYSHFFTVPADALLGPKRMRIRIDYNNPDPDPCGITTYGEVEDYTLNVVPSLGACCLQYGRCDQLSQLDCVASGGSEWALDVACEPNPCPQPELLTLLADRDCYRVDDPVTVEVWMNNIAAMVTGGQFFLAYDPLKLVFVSAAPGDADESDPLNPFEKEICAIAAAGTVDYAVGIAEPGADPLDPDGDDGTSACGTRRMAVLTFAAVAEICDEAGLVTWREHAPPTRLSDEYGSPVSPECLAADVVDHVAPALTCPTSVGIECDAPRDPDHSGWATATDNCDAAPLIEWSDTERLTGCDGTGAITRTWTATDHCGNVTICQQIITLVDRTPPELNCPGSLGVECGPDNAAQIADWLASATAWDACGDATVTHDYAGLSDECAATGRAVVTFTAEDDCGLISACTRTLTVADTVPPTFTPPGDVARNADAGYCTQLTLSTAEVGWPTGLHDDCSAAEHLTIDWVRSDGIAPPLPLESPFTGAITTIAWTVSDECGNVSAAQQQTVTILPYNSVQIDIELEGDLSADTLVRCVKLVFADTVSGAAVERLENVEFIRQPDGNALAALYMADLPCHAYDCVTAEDELHTLTVQLEPDLTPGGREFAVAFTGAAGRLLQGDLIDTYDEPTDFVDVLDFGVYVYQWGRVYDTSLPPELPDGDGNTPCGAFTRHADLNGDGVVDISDYAFISAHFLTCGDSGCAAGPGRKGAQPQENSRQAAPELVGPGQSVSSAGVARDPAHATRRPLRLTGPRVSITTAELGDLGLSHLALADLNQDGVLDAADVAAFEQGVRPICVPAGN